MNVEELKKHCEKQINLCSRLNDYKHLEEHQLVLNLIEENKQLKDNWNKLKKYMIDTEQIYKKSDDKYIKDMHEIGIRHAYQTILYKMYVLEQGSDSDE